MASDLFVVVTPHFVVREDQLVRLAHAHPRVEIGFVRTPEELAAELPHADAAITSFGLPPGSLARAPRLRWVHSMGAGVERFLTPEIKSSDLTVTATKGPMGPLMAEHAVALMFALTKRLPSFLRDQREHRWRRYPAERPPLVELRDKTLLILGVGAVGSELARIGKLGLGMRVLGFSRARQDCPHVDRYVERAELPSAYAEADVVSLSLPVTPATIGIVDAGAFAAMKPTAYLINVARGKLVDEAALIDALREGRIAGAGLDAFAAEPLSPDSPLWDLDNVVVTPHTSAITERLGDHFVDFWSENLRRFARGEPLLGLVDKVAGY